MATKDRVQYKFMMPVDLKEQLEEARELFEAYQNATTDDEENE